MLRRPRDNPGAGKLANLREVVEPVIQSVDGKGATVRLRHVVMGIVLEPPGNSPKTRWRVGIHIELELAECADVLREGGMVTVP